VDDGQTLRLAKVRTRQEAHDIGRLFSVTPDESVTRVGESTRRSLQKSVYRLFQRPKSTPAVISDLQAATRATA